MTVHEKVVAKLRGAVPARRADAAAMKLLSLMRKLPKHRGRKINVSGRVDAYLYGGAKTKWEWTFHRSYFAILHTSTPASIPMTHTMTEPRN